MPPRSASPATAATWLAIVAITGSGVSGANSAELASSMPARWRAASMTMHCRPRHSPSAGMPRSRAWRSAPTLPSMPRMPNPPGMTMPSSPASAAAAPAGVSQESDGTQRMCTLARCAKPPARSASTTDR